AKRWDEVIAACSRAIELMPDYAVCWNLRGNAYSQLGRYEEARYDYRKALELTPNNAGELNNLAWLLATHRQEEQRDPPRAVELARKAVELAPKEGAYWNTLGVAHYRVGEWKEALAALEKSMELRQGGDAFDWFFLAMARWQRGEKDEARKWYEEAAEWM